MKDLTEGNLEETLEFAKSIGDDSLQNCLNRMKKVEENWDEKVEHIISNDFAPRSFYFEKHSTIDGHYISNGGIIFHGKHDRGGDGGAPTFSVCLEPTNGWQIHT